MTKQQAILLLFVLIIVGGGATIYLKSTSVQGVTPKAGVTQNPPTTGVPAGSVSTNKTVLETLSYKVPNGNTENITVACVVDASGMIVDVTFSFSAPTNPESSQYLNKFNKAFSSSLLTGSKVGDKKLSRLGGASLTTKAFNDALGALAVKVGA